MDSRLQGEGWTEEVICPICLDFFTDPVILDCEHNFCRSCITRSWGDRERNSCPECRQEIPDRNLRGNRALANLAEKARRLSLNPEEKESKHHCEEHQEELKLFCETDKKLMCVICRDSPEHKSHNFLPIKDAVGIYKEEVSWKRRMNGIAHKLSITDGILSTEKFKNLFPFAVWNTIKPGKVSVILDVETAHPELEVSEDLKCLRWTWTRMYLPDTGKRFKHRACALGSEGFTSGGHYWEVEVEGNQGWSLGVASESVERKRGISLIPENGFWTMEWVGDRFYINSPLRSPLCVGQIPRKVGIYLSYESGTVSFYNADAMSLLHTYTGNRFTEKLYPFFETWDENQFLRICF
ncbi:nuclear factor 7, brain-like isoform X1 [Hemiscyllium ocellatum]|uniref:nuclear factor 7, brain-like isoform X1 n=1 Tax=Hemiscyllium ocellatum TaxID=170820 RepID=UPI00296757CB|nr:nuclear factor 7, brain-like isoform X1 [Hemiscyllium ocellatum]